MKKYVYSKVDELVTVETDGLGSINNFMVTGLIGNNYGGLVHAGLNFQMGDAVTIAEMINAAKRCECKLECYEGNQLIIDESGDFTTGVPAPIGIISSLGLGVAFNEATYNSEVPADYITDHDYESSKGSLPWLVAKFSKTGPADTPIQVQVFANDTQLELRGNVENVGDLSADKKTVTIKSTSYIMFEIVKDLGILYPKTVTWFTIKMIYDNRLYEAKVYVTPGSI